MLQNEQRAENTNKTTTKQFDNHQKSKNGRPLPPIMDLEANHPLVPPNQSDILKSTLNSSLNSTTAALSTENEMKVPSTLVSIICLHPY